MGPRFTIMRSMIFDGYCIPGTERDTNLSIEQLLQQMDDAGIAKAVIAPEDRELIVANVTGNDRHFTARLPSIRIDLCPRVAANPWYGVQPSRNSNAPLIAAHACLVLAPALQGFIPTDELCDDLL